MHKLKKIIAHPVFLTLISCFIIIQTGYAAPSPSTTPTPAPRDPGTVDRFTGVISGRVYDADTGNPLAGVTVTLTPNNYIDGATDYTTTTDQQGHYSASGMKCYYTTDRTSLTLTWLSYTASVSLSGYQDYESGELAFSRGYYAIGHDVALKPQPIQYGTITGIVTDAQTGKPLPNRVVSIKDVAYNFKDSALTDSQGRFTVSVQRCKSSAMGIQWLRYTVNIYGGGGYNDYTSSELAFSESVTTLEHNVVLVPLPDAMPKGTLSGQVIDADTKKPIANAGIVLKPYGPGWPSSGDYYTTTNSQGYYKIENLARGIISNSGKVTWLSYRVHIGKSGYEDYESTLVFSALVYDVVEDVQLETHPVTLSTGTITGIVTDAQTGKPIANVAVDIIDYDYIAGPVGPPAQKVITDSQGRFTATVPRSRTSGTAIVWCLYKLFIDSPPEGYGGVRTGLLVFSESVSSITCNLSLTPIPNPYGTITGTVIDAQTRKPLANVTVLIKPHFYGYGSRDYIITTDSLGRFSADVLPYVYSSGKLILLRYKVLIALDGYKPYTSTELSVKLYEWIGLADILLEPIPTVEIGQDIYLDASDNTSTQFSKPQIICDDTGYVVAVWQTQADSSLPTGHLRSRASLDSGLNWESIQEVVSSDMAAARIDDARLGQDEKGNVYLSWRMTKGNHQYLYVSRSLNHGYDWTDDRLIKDTTFLPGKERTVFQTGAPVNSKSPTIHLKCQDNTGRVYILETENKEDVELGGLLLAYSLDRGETWNEIGLGRVSDLQDLAMTCDNNGNVYLVGIRSASIAGQDTVSQNAVVFKALSFR